MRSVEEIQSFRDSRWILAAFTLVLIIPFTMLIAELVKNPAVETESWIGMIFTLGVLLCTWLFLFTMKTYVKIGDQRIAFRNSPFGTKLKSITTSEIKDWYISNHKWIHGLGYRITMHGGRAYAMRPGKVLVVKTKNGKEYRFGINRPALVQQKMKAMMEEGNTGTYG